MITVKYVTDKSQFKSITVTGHALANVKGKDLVCAAVSAVTIGAINALQNPQDFTIIVDEGHVEVQALRNILAHDQIVLDTMLISLKSIEESYAKYIKIIS
ncbi:MAG: ribosomal-processing cysteine protease Prp [Methanomicrobia archaeon]|jgi:uncharacterized protein YsxB (DUF464 family)|nr:ribosomal-processing cysteine protease Prp [Methanomicrobia archaeon]